MPIYLQAYLNLAYDRLEEQKKEAGRITNVDLQKKVQHLCVCVLFFPNIPTKIFYSLALNFILGGINILLLMCGNSSVCRTDSDVLIFYFNV